MTQAPLSYEQRHTQQKYLIGLVCLLAIVVIGGFDYLIGYRVSLLVFYAIPVGIATLYTGPLSAVVLALCAIAISRGGDLLSGMPYPGHVVFITNCAIPFTFFMLLIGAVYLLNHVRQGLEITVEQRNRALLQEMQERGRLERQVIELSEREHRRFGQELHDLVSQELAAIAIDAHLLSRNLVTSGQGEAERAREMALKVDRALSKARNIARGYFALGFDATGLAEALREIAQRTAKASGVTCDVRCEENLAIGNEDATIQLFRIAQEALQNAARHSGASRIILSFERQGDNFILTVEDNGKGLPATVGKNGGLGLSIMAYRAGIIGGKFVTERPSSGGTRVTCRVPAVKLTRHDSAVVA